MRNYWISHRTLLLILLMITVPEIKAGPFQNPDEGPAIIDEIVAKINSEIITLTDLTQSLNQLRLAVEQDIADPQGREEAFSRRKRFLLKSMIQSKIMIQRAEELGVTADIDVDVSAYLEQMREEAGIPNLEVLDQYFRQNGTSLTEYRENVKEQMITRSLLQQFVYSKITLLTPEVEAYYRENADKFRVSAEVELAEILFLTEGKEKEAVRKRAEEALSRLGSGEPFEELAKEFSDGPTASKGGGIGEFKRGSINEALEAVVFDMAAGETSGVIETEYGFQIVRIINITPEAVKPLDEVRPEIADALYQKKAEPEVKEFIKQLIEESYIFVAPKYVREYDLEGLV